MPVKPARMQRNAYILLILTMLFWAGNSIAGKLAVGNISPMLFNSLRWLVAGTVLAVIYHRAIRAEWAVLKRNALLFLILGGFGFTGFSIGLFTALIYTSAINVSIQQASLPLMVFLFNFLLFRTGVSGAHIAGFLLSSVGVALTVSNGNLSRLLEMDFNTGDLIMLAAVVCYGGYTAALRLKPVLRWQTLLFALSLAGFLTSLPFTAWEFAAGKGILPTGAGWAILAFTAIFPSLLGQAFFIGGVELIGANRAGLFINLVPIFATLLSIVILGEAFYLHQCLALALVLGGIWLAEHHGWRKRAAG